MTGIVVIVVAVVVIGLAWPRSDPAGGRGPRARIPALSPMSHPHPGPNAVQTAVAFSRAYLAGGPVDRFATAALAAELADSPGAPALDAEAERQGAVVAVGPVTATVDDTSAGSVGVSIVASVQLRSEHESVSLTDYLDLLVVQDAGIWRVDQIQV